MVGKIAVVAEQEFDDWLQGSSSVAGHEQPGGRVAGARRAATVPQAPVHRLPHGDAPTPQAPSWKSCYGSRRCRSATDGAWQKIADDAYILESILNPRAKVVEAWKPIMPGHYAEHTTAEELNGARRVHQEPEARADARPDRADSRPRSGRRTRPRARRRRRRRRRSHEHHD